MSDTSFVNIAKEAAGKKAVDFIEDGMLVGIGTGSTSSYFIRHLAKKCHSGLKIQAVPSSNRSMSLAKSLRIPLADINSIDHLDVTVDGADEIDTEKRMIKGGGGALFREKIIANMSQEMIVIVDSSKRVDYLGKFSLPVEIYPFGYLATIRKLSEAGYSGVIRPDKDKSPLKTDNGNFLFDVALTYPCLNPEPEHHKIKSIPGVIETGFFIHLAGRVIVGYPDQHIEIIPQ